MSRAPHGGPTALATTTVATAVLLVLTLAAVAPAAALHQVQHVEPAQPAVDRFADDVPRLLDDEWGIPIGGFGGIERDAPRSRHPVVFVHGNVVDHGDWYPVRDDFLAAGWTMQELWALSYNGMGNGSGSTPVRDNPERDEDHAGADNLPRGTNNDVNVPDLAAFVAMVRDYTGADGVHLVGHSLGVTLIRRTMDLHPALAADVVSVVAIAGANHGTSLCTPQASRGTHMSCDEIDAGTSWLDALNGPAGERETYGPTRWLTVYDGTGTGDAAFVGPDYAHSPRLEGAENVTFPNVDHNALRVRPDVVAFYRQWIETVDTAARSPAASDDTALPGPAPRGGPTPVADDGTPLPATGDARLGLGGVLLLAGLVRRRRR